MPWPVTINGHLYTLADVAPYTYANTLPNILQDVADVAQAVVDAAAASGVPAAEATVASAATTNIGALTNYRVAITGTTTITSFGISTNRTKLLRFTDSLILTHSATSLFLPGSANILTRPGDTAVATSDGSGNWRVRSYQRGALQPVEASNFVPPGSAGLFFMNSAPSGWLKAHGATVSRSAYAALFAVIGTTFGAGDGSTTFNLPDARGEFLRGFDDGRGVDAGRAFGSSQADQMASHAHATPFGMDANGQITAWIGGGSLAFYGSDTVTGAGSQVLNPDFFQGRTVYNARTSGPSNISGENRPRNLAPLACIKF